MNISEAYNKVISVALLAATQMNINIVISKTKASNDQQFMKNISIEYELPPSKWIHIEFKIDTKQQLDYIFDLGKKLSQNGISFDTGFGCGVRDWQIDWSLCTSEEIK